jgi:hypothetical protein
MKVFGRVLYVVSHLEVIFWCCVPNYLYETAISPVLEVLTYLHGYLTY